MRIGILTQPLHNNYGGILQAYALQYTLKSMGNEVWIINRDFRRTIRVWEATKWLIKFGLNRKQNSFIQSIDFPSRKERRIIAYYTSQFIKENISLTDPIVSSKGLRNCLKNGFDCFIVGSDQVWRPVYSPCISNYFLDFIETCDNVKRIAYAASFGVDCWEFNDKQAQECCRLVQKFNAVSVREDSAIKLCKEYFNINAQHVIDPTLLLTPNEYKVLINKENESLSHGGLFFYILDNSIEKMDFINIVSKKLGLTSFTVMPNEKFSVSNRININNCVFPPVTKWIKAFFDAQYVITDSFHGCVFSILCNVPFIAIGNYERGITRFTSLLKMFNLTDRIISLPITETFDFLKPIDWESVNKKIEKERIRAFNFLIDNLSI